ncbi:hypothetical protein HBI29_039100 [Parastagonospora nodorum]|nr:hypothetical protein HBI29_039100 [Parastagonospora nodorum]
MWRAILFLTLIFIPAVCGQMTVTPIFSDVATNSSFGAFTSPNETHHAFVANETMTISWRTSLDAIYLVLYQRDILAGLPIERIDNPSEGETLWKPFSIETGPGILSEFVFRAVVEGGDSSKEFWSPTFSILRDRDELNSLPTLTATPTSTRIASNAQETDLRFASGSNSLSTPTGGLSIGLTIGLAATFTAGSVAIVVYLLYFLYKRIKTKAKNPELSPAGSYDPDADLPELCTYQPVPHGSPGNPVEMEVKPAEMEGTRTYAELPAEPRELPDVRDLDELVIERHG